MDRFARLITMMASAYLLAAPIRADDLKKMLGSRQQVLSQFNDGNSATLFFLAIAPVTPVRPPYDSPITVQELPVLSSPCATAILSGQGQSGDTMSQAASHQHDGNAGDLTRSAMGLSGVVYCWSGTLVRTGLDCSGLMQHIFRNSMGVSLPRTSAVQTQMGTIVSHGELQPGDMAFLHAVCGRVFHVDLSTGNNRSIHIPRTGKHIEITSLGNKYWNRKYAFGRRVKKNDPPRLLN